MSVPPSGVSYVCKRCRVALDWESQAGWIHPIAQVAIPGVWDHEPEPVPAEEVSEYRYRCDFCFIRDPAWTYPTESFVMEPMAGLEPNTGSWEDWAACDKCHDIIETGDRSKLVYRIMRVSPVYQHTTGVKRKLLETMLHDLMRQFLASRKGEAYREG